MRLLEANSVGKFSLKDFGDEIPPYAILSHTWGLDNEEITFGDITNGTGGDKPGYEKIRFCGEQAKQDGLLYFWIDTCCIDKTNKAELARSINCMFRWYRNATRCYVYLSDVSGPVDANKECNPRPWESDFRKSRWFTRGWTLQELLAPASVEFFSQERKRLGDKTCLRQLICEITNLPHSALQGDPLSQFSFQERSRWIQHRQTKLEEDKAYSLLGIFDVYILPIYGEGEPKAFDRLKDEFDKMQKCIQDLRTTDPREDKKRIEQTKGGLLEDSYRWILEHSDFQQWRDDEQSRLLWIKGDPGKGKTMLLCGIINEMSPLTRRRDEKATTLLSYFFCQATDERINNAEAVLRGLIYLLIDQQPSLVSHVQKKYNQGAKKPFEGVNAWVALTMVFEDILQDPSLPSTYLIVDALDECVKDLPELLDLIDQKSSVSSRVKWIVSSRNWPDIEERLETAGRKVKLRLELNEKSVFAAVNIYIRHRVGELARLKRYNLRTQKTVGRYLSLNANGTFLWVALVCQELKKISGPVTGAKLKAFPPGLDSLYERMMEQVYKSDSANLCKQILSVVAIIYRPITMEELMSFVGMPEDISDVDMLEDISDVDIPEDMPDVDMLEAISDVDILEHISDDFKSLKKVIGLCGSFLTIRGYCIYFVHQSAKDFLLGQASSKIFPLGIQEKQHALLSKSLEVMSQTLRRDIYGLRAPGFSIDSVILPNPDPLNAVGYLYMYWVDHLCASHNEIGLGDNGIVHVFLKEHFLHWMEALSFLKSVISGILALHKLENFLRVSLYYSFYALIIVKKKSTNLFQVY
jgi:hypothetical protein